MARFTNTESTEFTTWFKENKQRIADMDLPGDFEMSPMYMEPRRIRLYSLNSYDIRNTLKASGWKFNDGGVAKSWYKDYASIDDALVAVGKIQKLR